MTLTSIMESPLIDKKGLIFMLMKYLRELVIIVPIIAILSGCATTGPSIIKTYDSEIERSQIAVVRLEQKMSLRVLSCDGIAVPRSARYLLVKPGHHELVFTISGQTLVEVYRMTNKKFLEAVGGHTYMLKSETGWFSIGDKWFPIVIDVTDDPKLHVKELSSAEAQMP